MKTIEVDPLDITSINKAITVLKAHEVWRKRKITEYLSRLAKIGRDAAEKAYYGGSVNPNHMPSGEEGLRVSVVDTPDGIVIRATGSQVVFMEFGAGVYVQDHELSQPLPIEIMPGSWSESPEGAHTWSKWLEDGRRFGDYKYNRSPRAGMYEAYKAIVEAQERIAQEVFGKDD